MKSVSRALILALSAASQFAHADGGMILIPEDPQIKAGVYRGDRSFSAQEHGDGCFVQIKKVQAADPNDPAEGIKIWVEASTLPGKVFKIYRRFNASNTAYTHSTGIDLRKYPVTLDNARDTSWLAGSFDVSMTFLSDGRPISFSAMPTPAVGFNNLRAGDADRYNCYFHPEML